MWWRARTDWTDKESRAAITHGSNRFHRLRRCTLVAAHVPQYAHHIASHSHAVVMADAVTIKECAAAHAFKLSVYRHASRVQEHTVDTRIGRTRLYEMCQMLRGSGPMLRNIRECWPPLYWWRMLTHAYGTMPTDSLKLMAAAACCSVAISACTMAHEMAAVWCT